MHLKVTAACFLTCRPLTIAWSLTIPFRALNALLAWNRPSSKTPKLHWCVFYIHIESDRDKEISVYKETTEGRNGKHALPQPSSSHELLGTRPETRLRDNTSSRRLPNSPISSGISAGDPTAGDDESVETSEGPKPTAEGAAERLEKREREREKNDERENDERQNNDRE